MPHSRRLPRVPATGRITVRLTTRQRDAILESGDTPKDLGHTLHRAHVTQGKLSVRLTRETVDTLIGIVARAQPVDRESEREMTALVRYLESLFDRFADADTPGQNAEYADNVSLPESPENLRDRE